MSEKAESKKKQLKEALEELEKALKEPETDISRDASIKRFEFTMELAWKYMQTYVNEQGIESYGPNNSIREAAKLGLINNAEKWLEFAKMRNQTSHIYDEKMAQGFYVKLPEFVTICSELVN